MPPLNPEIAALLERQKGQPARSSLDVAATRERMRLGAGLAGPSAAVARVNEHELPGGIAAREYWPEVDEGLPRLVFFHGGRFFSGDLVSHDAMCRSLALASGWRVLAVDYRLAPEHKFPAALQDACVAVRWAAATPGKTRIAVAGDSAGANLAAGAARLCRDVDLCCQVLIYPMIDATCGEESHREFATGYGPESRDMLRGWQEYLAEGDDPRHPDISPLFARDLAGLPPALVITAEYDTLRDEGERYAGMLSGARLVRYDGMIHGFLGMAAVTDVAGRAMAEIGEFLRTVRDGIE
jgi:acetyl esterase